MGEARTEPTEGAAAVQAGVEAADVVVDVGLVVATSSRTDRDRLREFATGLASDVVDELAAATDAGWRFYREQPEPLSDAEARRPSQFLDEAALRMVEGPYDAVVVVTDVPLLSRRHRRVGGLASPLSRVAVISTHRLRIAGREEPTRPLDSPAVRRNGAALLLHQLGHLLGAGHDPGDGAMAPFSFDPDRERVPDFDAEVSAQLRRVAGRVPEEETSARGTLRGLGFHLRSVARNPRQVLAAVLNSRAPLLPLSLAKLSTAAVAPTLILVFSAEAWDVGLNLDNGTAALFAGVSVLLAATYLVFSHGLTFPPKRRGVVTEHLALVNVTVFCILLLAMIGLFALVCSIMLVIELVVFPPNLMTNWPSLEDPSVSFVDLLRIGAFISTIGVLSGALAGGLENRAIVRHLALFLARP